MHTYIYIYIYIYPASANLERSCILKKKLLVCLSVYDLFLLPCMKG